MDSLEDIQMEPSALTAEDLANEDNEVWVLHCPANVSSQRCDTAGELYCKNFFMWERMISG